MRLLFSGRFGQVDGETTDTCNLDEANFLKLVTTQLHNLHQQYDMDTAAGQANSQSLSQRTFWIESVFALYWAIVAAWLLYATCARQRHSAATFRRSAILVIEQAILMKHELLNASTFHALSPPRNKLAYADELAVRVSRPEVCQLSAARSRL